MINRKLHILVLCLSIVFTITACLKDYEELTLQEMKANMPETLDETLIEKHLILSGGWVKMPVDSFSFTNMTHPNNSCFGCPPPSGYDTIFQINFDNTGGVARGYIDFEVVPVLFNGKLEFSIPFYFRNDWSSGPSFIVNTITWITGNTIEYAFNASDELFRVAIGDIFNSQNAAFPKNNGFFEITAIDIVNKTIQITNPNRNDNVDDEAPGSPANGTVFYNKNIKWVGLKLMCSDSLFVLQRNDLMGQDTGNVSFSIFLDLSINKNILKTCYQIPFEVFTIRQGSHIVSRGFSYVWLKNSEEGDLACANEPRLDNLLGGRCKGCPEGELFWRCF